MKKLFTLCSFALVSLLCAAQNDTLLYENFDVDVTANPNFIINNPPASAFDSNWYDYDADGLPDQSGSSRPGEWYWRAYGFADADSSDGCLWSNSWTLDPNPVLNYLITPAIQIVDANASVSWASAPFQTPRYLDGYFVLVSRTTNDPSAFTDTLFIAAENDGWASSQPDSSFAYYNFIPTGPGVFIHGLDGTYVEYHGDSIRLTGMQQPFTRSLAAYSGDTIYIAFLHGTHDDNLLNIDDILVKGTSPVSVNEVTKDEIKLYSYPNPAGKNIHLNFTLNKPSDVVLTVTDILGNAVLNETLKNISGKYSYTMNVEKLSGGTYYYTVTSSFGRSANKFVVLK